jgi:biopolymer transport protein ExbB
MTVWSYLAQGDALNRLVALVLLAMSVASWVVILWRVWLLRSAVTSVQLSLPVFWQSADWADAVARLQASDPQRLVLPLVQAAQRVLNAAGTGASSGVAPATAALPTLGGQASTAQQLTRLLRDALVAGQQRLQFGQVLLATVGATAPFVGLLGTVWGIYHALVAIAAEGQVTIDKVAGPVGEALVMTAAGLAVAIPAVLAYNVLGKLAARTEAALEAFAHDLREWVLQPPAERR